MKKIWMNQSESKTFLFSFRTHMSGLWPTDEVMHLDNNGY